MGGSLKSTLRAAIPWAVPTVALVGAVLLGWTGAFGDRMNLGGDDSHLYYADPWRWLGHAPLTVIDNGFSGFNARVFFAPFVAAVGVLSWLPFNVQGLCFGLLLAATWTGVARLVLDLLGDRPGAHAAAQFAASVTTVAPVVAATQWMHQLYPIYWMAALPWLVVFVLRHQSTGSWRWVWLSVGTTVLLAPAMSAVPWTGACALLAAPLVAVGLAARRITFRPNRLLVLAGATTAANLFWLVPMAASAVGGQVQFTDASSDQGRESAAATVRTLATVQQGRDTAALRVSSRLLEAFGVPAAEPNRWSERLHPIGLLPLAFAVVGALAAIGRDRRLATVMAGLLVLWLTFFWLSTVSVVPWGTRAFVWLTHQVPGWTAFRNFHDKFAIPFATIAGLAAGVGFASLSASWHRVARGLTATALVAASVVYGLPLLRGEHFRLPYVAASRTNRVSTGLPHQYRTLLSVVDGLPPGGVLTVPLRVPAWSVVSTAERGAYLGISPVNLLTGRSDINGRDVAPRPAEAGVTADLTDAVRRADVRGVAEAVRHLGVSYVVAGQLVDVALADRIRVGSSVESERDVWRRYVSEFAPRVVWRNGDFAVHEIRRGWRTETIELRTPLPSTYHRMLPGESRADGGAGCFRRLQWTHVSPVHIRASLPPRPRGCAVVLRQAYHSGWRATVGGSAMEPRRASGFAMQFAVPASSRVEELEITFAPQRLVPLSAGASLLSLAILALVSQRSVSRSRRGVRAPTGTSRPRDGDAPTFRRRWPQVPTGLLRRGGRKPR